MAPANLPLQKAIVDFDRPPGDYRDPCGLCSKSPRDKPLGVTILSSEHGVAHCFRCGYVEHRHERREMSAADLQAYRRRMDALRRQHHAEQRQAQLQAAAEAAIRWAAAAPVAEHPYLTTKGIKPHGVRIEAGALLIPMRDTEGRLHSLQAIGADGSKRFMPGGRVKGCYCSIGRPNGKVVICEGYATGVTIHEDTGHAVAVAFNSGNLLPVAKALRARFPCITLVIAADDDWKTEGNPGLTSATEAAAAVGGLLAIPDFTGLPRGEKDTDYNDLHRLAGMVEVAQ